MPRAPRARFDAAVATQKKRCAKRHIPLERMRGWLLELQKANLLSPVHDFDDSVSISFIDGSHMLFIGAFYVTVDDWIVILTENHGYHVFSLQDINGVMPHGKAF